jgi:hypothetical protein
LKKTWEGLRGREIVDRDLEIVVEVLEKAHRMARCAGIDLKST